MEQIRVGVELGSCAETHKFEVVPRFVVLADVMSVHTTGDMTRAEVGFLPSSGVDWLLCDAIPRIWRGDIRRGLSIKLVGSLQCIGALFTM